MQDASAQADFSGPLFVVGMPRSGTKLLRDLLNQNDRISIPNAESHFIPYFVEKYGDSPGFDDRRRFDAFLSDFRETAFHWNMANKGVEMDESLIARVGRAEDWATVFECILRHYAPSGNDSGVIWGDKTPRYIAHIGLMRSLYPNARFIHIIRDPRDYVLSVRKAWGKSMYLAAHNWNETVSRARAAASELGRDYTELFYESLLADPENEIRRLCEFVGCAFDPRMLSLATPTENLGDAKGQVDIVASNSGKYKAELTVDELRNLEEILLPALTENTPYVAEAAHGPRKMGRLRRKTHRLLDAVAAARFHMRQKGLLSGFHYAKNLSRKSR